MVRETSTWRSDSSHQYPAARSSAVSGSGMRDIHRSENAWMSPGPSRWQVICKPSGSSQRANPLDSSVKPIRALASWRLAHSCPLSQTFTGYGKYAQILMNAGP